MASREETQLAHNNSYDGSTDSGGKKQGTKKKNNLKTRSLEHKKAHYLTKVLIGDIIFTSPTGDGTIILRDFPNHAKVYPLAVQREYLDFS